MPAINVIGRIQEIQSTLNQLSSPAVAPAPTSSTAPAESAATVSAPVEPSATAELFASVLSEATGEVPPAEAPAAPVAPVSSAVSAPLSGPFEDTAIFQAAQKYIGINYVWGGNDPSLGLDCSSFVQNVYRDLGYELPRTTWDQINQGRPVASMADAQPGDLLFSFNTGHVAIYLGDGKAIDAPQPGQTIQVRDAWELHEPLSGIRRILPDGAGAAAAAAGPGELVSAAQGALMSGSR